MATRFAGINWAIGWILGCHGGKKSASRGVTCTFYVFRYGMSMATLICEDLARIDPVQTVIRAIGPNLVIALLMDGPQWQRRWSGRYATVLADDPGSAVLSVTLARYGAALEDAR